MPPDPDKERAKLRAEAGPRATTPNGAPFPLRSWSPDAAIDIQNLATWVDTNAVATFANIAARDAAYGSPTAAALEGRVCYLKDTGTVQQHNGFVWVGDTAWKTPTNLNGWTGGASYRMDCQGTVSFIGTIARGGANTGTGSMCSVPVPNYAPASIDANIITWTWNNSAQGAALVTLARSTGILTLAAFIAGSPTSVNQVGTTFSYRADFKAVR